MHNSTDSSTLKFQAQDALIFSNAEYDEMRSQLTSDTGYDATPFPYDVTDPIKSPNDIRLYQEITSSKLNSAKKSLIGNEGRIKILKVTDGQGTQKEVILYYKDQKLHQHIHSIDQQNDGMVEKVAKDIHFYLALAKKFKELNIINPQFLTAFHSFEQCCSQKSNETLDVYQNFKKQVLDILVSNSTNPNIQDFIGSHQADANSYLNVANFVVAQQFMRSVALRNLQSSLQSLGVSPGGSLNLASNAQERAKVTGRGITVDYDASKPTQITVKRYNYDRQGQQSPVSNVVYIKIKKLTVNGDFDSSALKKFALDDGNKFCFLKISFDAFGKPKIDTDNVYVTDQASEKPITKMPLTTIEQSKSSDSALLISSLKQMTINVENYDIDEQMEVSKVQENFTKRNFFENSSAQKIQKVFRGHRGRKEVKQARQAEEARKDEARQAEAARLVEDALRQAKDELAREVAAQKINRVARGMLARKKFKNLNTEKAEKDAAEKLQAFARRANARKKAASQIKAEVKIINAIENWLLRGKLARIKTHEAEKDAAEKLQVFAIRANAIRDHEAKRAAVTKLQRLIKGRRAKDEYDNEAARRAEEATRQEAARRAEQAARQEATRQAEAEEAVQRDIYSELPNFLQRLYNDSNSFTNHAQGQKEIISFHVLAGSSSSEGQQAKPLVDDLSQSITSLIDLLNPYKIESFKVALGNYLKDSNCEYSLSQSQKNELIAGVLKKSEAKTSEDQSSPPSQFREEKPGQGIRGRAVVDVPESWEERSTSPKSDDVFRGAVSTGQNLQGDLPSKNKITEESFMLRQKGALKRINLKHSARIDEVFSKIYQSLPIGNTEKEFKLEEYKLAMGELLSICDIGKSKEPIEQIKSSLTTSGFEKYNLSEQEKLDIDGLSIDECKKTYTASENARKRAEAEEARRLADEARQAEKNITAQKIQQVFRGHLGREEAKKAQAEAQEVRRLAGISDSHQEVRSSAANNHVWGNESDYSDAESDAESVIDDSELDKELMDSQHLEGSQPMGLLDSGATAFRRANQIRMSAVGSGVAGSTFLRLLPNHSPRPEGSNPLNRTRGYGREGSASSGGKNI